MIGERQAHVTVPGNGATVRLSRAQQNLRDDQPDQAIQESRGHPREDHFAPSMRRECRHNRPQIDQDNVGILERQGKRDFITHVHKRLRREQSRRLDEQNLINTLKAHRTGKCLHLTGYPLTAGATIKDAAAQHGREIFHIEES